MLMQLDMEKVIDGILAVEKGFVDDPVDNGGPTNFGVTEAVARANGYTGSMADMPETFAREVYRKRYITEPRFHDVAAISVDIAAELIDTGVNCGPSVAATFLQRWLNGFNQQGSRYSDLFVDGRIGGVTLDALKAFIEWRGVSGVKAMVAGLNAAQAMRYLSIAENNSSQEKYLYGWMINRVVATDHE